MDAPRDDRLYDPAFVRRLFDEMAGTYGVVNLIASFGFAARWRRQCLRLVPVRPGAAALDLMTGMGELVPDLARRVGPEGSVRAVDLSPVMCRLARKHISRAGCPVEVVEADALGPDLPPGSADAVVSSFGLKTFDAGQTERLAAQVARALKPGGAFALVEISVPPNRWLRRPYLFYLRHVIPWVGRLFLGNPDNYRLLGVYTEAFGDCRGAAEAFARAGLAVRPASFFFGCATGLHGHKPASD